MSGATDGLLSIAGGLGVLGCCLGLQFLLVSGISLGSVGLTGYISSTSIAVVAIVAIIGSLLVGVGLRHRWSNG